MPEETVVPSIPMRILKITTCSSLSGRSELTYHIVCNAEGEIHFRIVGNSGSGQFNTDAVPFNQISKLLSEHPTDKPLTSTAMRPVFRGKSSNSPAFLFAALKAESIVLPGADKDGGVYLIGDMEAFKQAMTELIASEPAVTDTTPDKPAKKKPVGRKPAGKPIP